MENKNRFLTKLAKDPRFKKIPKKSFKLEIDSRFKNVFESQNEMKSKSKIIYLFKKKYSISLGCLLVVSWLSLS